MRETTPPNFQIKPNRWVLTVSVEIFYRTQKSTPDNMNGAHDIEGNKYV